MAVKVSLELLVTFPATVGLWPKEFYDLTEAAEIEPNERTRFGVMADWCDENDEPGLARACRYIAKRVTVTVEKENPDRYSSQYWRLTGLPPSLRALMHESHRSTLIAMVSDLAKALREHDAAAE